MKASIRAKVEHPFLDVKRIFGYAKVRYRGLAKNTNRLALLLGLSNLMRARPCGQLTRGAVRPIDPANSEQARNRDADGSGSPETRQIGGL